MQCNENLNRFYSFSKKMFFTMIVSFPCKEKIVDVFLQEKSYLSLNMVCPSLFLKSTVSRGDSGQAGRLGTEYHSLERYR